MFPCKGITHSWAQNLTFLFGTAYFLDERSFQEKDYTEIL